MEHRIRDELIAKQMAIGSLEMRPEAQAINMAAILQASQALRLSM